ncbi:MAG: SpoIIE family protein phosphatase [Candidatus Latescibacteria bacterium]|nr:SpoIIE family protein phosphatase [Candidatus Latescibacterota bacterium]NIO28392.1 SpoIIE family protein phosphatase [Candidatus Latescibacterota bacterium]NIO55941.1 SpoIIE family protein phosphatase [Candidatus Latescibacterota bacterium]NIT01905.1 SpoIIE family protein phosphatase [Candidatus Latescibacterota bacterium]
MDRLDSRRAIGKRLFRKPKDDPKAAKHPPTASPKALQEELERLERALDELSFLNELAREISGSRSSKDIIKEVIQRSLQAVSAEQAVVTLVRERAAKPMKKETYMREVMSSREMEQYHCTEKMLEWMHDNKRPIVINDPHRDKRFGDMKWAKTISSILCVPLLVKSELKGVLSVYNKKEGKKFTEDDERFLGIIGSQSAQVIENARLYEEEQELLNMQEELKVARRIQERLLPKEPPHIPGYDIAGRSIPARLVGGDYFDFMRVSDDCWAVCVGDVSGKGLPASLLMANLGATLRGQAMLSNSPKECLYRSNSLLYHCTDSETFATVFYGILDTKNHVLNFTSGGHEAALHFSSESDSERLKTIGLVLGVVEEAPFEEKSVSFNTGDLLVIYSDGVIDTENANGEHFGEKKLKEVIQKNRHESPDEVIDRILAAVEFHAGGIPQIDDITIVVLRRTDTT